LPEQRRKWSIMDTVEDTAARFRRRARECRDMAQEVQEADWRNTLLGLAQDLVEEADRIDAERASD